MQEHRDGLPVARLASPPEAERLLGDALDGWPGGTGPLRVQAVTVLRAHAGRCTLRYVVRRGGEERTLIGKVHAEDRRDVADLLGALRAGGLGAGQPAQVPAPVAYLPEPRFLLVEEAPGVPARALLRGNELGVLERVAGWLAALHAAKVPLPAARRARDPLRKARRWAQTLSGDVPELAGAARDLLAALEARPPTTSRPHLVHGDFSVSHVYIAPDTTTVIDWDSWEVGDGAEDAGRFLASLCHVAARHPERHAGLADGFARLCRETVPAARENLSFHGALSCLRTAKRLAASGVPHRVGYAGVLLADGRRILDGGG